MASESAFLVVGGDSLVGGGLVNALVRRGHRTFATTRRRDTLDAGRVYLDFDTIESFKPPEGIGYVYLVAAATNYDRCETDPTARRTNVERVPQLVAALLEQDLPVSFISTNSVFGGERPWPQEDDPHEPLIAYAKQKSEGEAAIRAATERFGASDRLNIVRLTKILGPNVPPLPAWFAAWQRRRPVEPFSDLIFAPMSLGFVSDALATIGERRIVGNLHLSGAANISYVDLAHALARRLDVATTLIQPTTAVARGVSIAFKPRFSGLGMSRTTQLTGIRPQPLDQVADDLTAGTTGRSERHQS